MSELELLKRLLNYFFLDTTKKYRKEEMENRKKLVDILNELGSVAEGVKTSKALCELADKLNIEVPVSSAKYFEKTKKEAIKDLITKYFIYRNNSNFLEEDIADLRISIDMLMRRIGFRGKITDNILLKFRNGEIDVPTKMEYLKEKLKESYYQREKNYRFL